MKKIEKQSRQRKVQFYNFCALKLWKSLLKYKGQLQSPNCNEEQLDKIQR